MKNAFFVILSAIILPLVIFYGCTSTGSYQSTRVYDRSMYSRISKKSMEYEGPARNPVIFIHGFLGAKLAETSTGELVWGSFTGIEDLNDNKLRALSHPMAKGKMLWELQSNSQPVGLLDRVKIKLLGVPFYLSAYDNLIDLLIESGYMLEGNPLPEDKNFYSLFVFYYDWRRDIPENAARLHQFILDKRAYLQRQYHKLYKVENYDVQFDVVAHSMGGLLARYYLQYGNQDLPSDGYLPALDWRGSKYIDKVAMIGTPNSGYLDTFLEMTSGLELAPGAPVYPPGLIGTYPTYYEMMPPAGTRSVVYEDDPNGPPVDLFDPQLWIKYKWGLANPDQDEIFQITLPEVTSEEERRSIAIDHMIKCLNRARRFSNAIKVSSPPPDDVTMALFVGDAVPTTRTATVNRQSGAIDVSVYEAGDGKVLSSSARMDEREGTAWTPFERSPIQWDYVMHFRAAHMGITNSKEFIDNIRYYLLIRPTKKQLRTMNATPTPIHDF